MKIVNTLHPGVVTGVVLIEADDDRFCMASQYQRDALENWLKSQLPANSEVIWCKNSLLEENSLFLDPGAKQIIANVTGGSKELSASLIDLVSNLSIPGEINVIDAHSQDILWCDVRSGRNTEVPPEAYLRIEDYLTLNFYIGSPFSAILCKGTSSTNRFFNVALNRLKSFLATDSVLLIEEVKKRYRFLSERSAIMAIVNGRPLTISVRLISECYEAKTYKKSRKIREAVRVHRELARHLAGDTGVPVWLKQNYENFHDVRTEDKNFDLNAILSFYSSKWVQDITTFQPDRTSDDIQLSNASSIVGGPSLILLIGHQPAPLMAAAISFGEIHERRTQFILLATQETVEIAKNLSIVLNDYGSCVLVIISANDYASSKIILDIILRSKSDLNDTEINITGGTQINALRLYHLASNNNIHVSYTRGLATNPLGIDKGVRLLKRKIPLHKYFYALGYNTSTLANINLKTILNQKNMDIIDRAILDAFNTLNSNSRANMQNAYSDLIESLERLILYKILILPDRKDAKKLLTRRLYTEDPKIIIGNSYELYAMLLLMKDILRNEEAKSHIWQIAWSVTLTRIRGPQSPNESGMHEIDILIITSDGPVFLEMKHSLDSALDNEGHLKILDIARAHSANYGRSAIIFRNINDEHKSEIWTGIDESKYENLRFFTSSPILHLKDCSDSILENNQGYYCKDKSGHRFFAHSGKIGEKRKSWDGDAADVFNELIHPLSGLIPKLLGSW